MPIEAMRLRRFRGFVDVRLPLAPLTVLLGPNSAGKSCFGHALVGLAQAQRNAGANPIDLAEPKESNSSWWPVDLGEFDELRTSGEVGPIGIGMTTQHGDVDLDFGAVKQVSPLGVTRIEYSDDPAWAQSPANTGPHSTRVVATHVGEIENPRPPFHEFRRGGTNAWMWRNEQIELVANGLDVRTAWLSSTGSAVPFPRGPGEFLATFLRSVRYLRATRNAPHREYARSPKEPEDVGPSGEWTADYLATHGDTRRVEVHLPPEVATTVEQAKRILDAPWPKSEMGLIEAVGVWLRHMGLAESVSARTIEGRRARLDAVLRPKGHSRPLTDLGFGLSQTIPVLVAGLELGKDDLLVVELPEAQLHPVPQALFADFFCSIVKRGARVLVETHSEPFFHRLRVRAAFDRELASKIGAWFIDAPDRATGRCTAPRSVDLDDEFRWPEGFLVEGYTDEMALRAARGARRLGGD